MSGDESFLKGKHILAVDDEKDILETITDILDESVIDWAWEYQNASKKIKTVKYDFGHFRYYGCQRASIHGRVRWPGNPNRDADRSGPQPENTH